jgi:hypothetical protein
MPEKHPQPTTARQAQQNIQHALALLQAKKPGGLTACWGDEMSCVRALMKGEKDAIWTLLAAIRELYPQSESRPQTHFHLRNTGLPYSLEDLRKLEVSLLCWLDRLGLVPPERPQRPNSLLEIEADLRNGTLLCGLAELLSGTRLTGVFRQPKTDATCQSNLRKAFECLRKIPNITHKCDSEF